MPVLWPHNCHSVHLKAYRDFGNLTRVLINWEWHGERHVKSCSRVVVIRRELRSRGKLLKRSKSPGCITVYITSACRLRSPDQTVCPVPSLLTITNSWSGDNTIERRRMKLNLHTHIHIPGSITFRVSQYTHMESIVNCIQSSISDRFIVLCFTLRYALVSV